MQPLPEDIAARLDRPMPWWKLLDEPDLSGSELITRQAGTFAQRLSKFRVAVVPDPRVDAGGITGDTPCIAFRIPVCNRHASHEYTPALQQLRRDLAFLTVKGRPSPRELTWVRNRGLEAFRLDIETRERLLAQLELMLHEPMENAESVIRAIGEDVSISWRGDQYARYRDLCEADGPLDELEKEALKLVTKGGAVTKRQLSIFDEPLPMREPVTPNPKKTLPAKPVAPKVPPKPAPKTLALLLDESRIADISRQTKAVDSLLGDVFTEEVEPAAAPVVPSTATSAPAASWRDALAIAEESSTWDCSALFARWSSLGLMPQAMLDELNERALDEAGELLFEGDDTFDVNMDVLQTLKGTA